MAKFRITDNQTGKSVVVSGDTPPSATDAESIFKSAGLRDEKPQPQSNPLMSVLNFIAPQTTKLYGTAVDALKTGYENRDTMTPQQKMQLYTDSLQKVQSLQPKAGLELSSYVVPAGEGVPAAMGSGALSGALYGASKDNADLKSVGTSALAGGVASGVLTGAMEKGGELISKTLTKTGQKVQDQGEQLVLRGLRPSKSQLTKFRDKTGVDLADYLAEKGITGNFKDEAANLARNLQDNYDEIVLRSGKTVTPDQFDELTKPVIDQFKSSNIPEVKQKAGQIAEYFNNIKAAYGDNPIPLSDIVKNRRELDQLIPPSAFDVNPTTTKYFRATRDAMKNVIDEATKDVKIAGLGTKELGQELKKAYLFKDIAETQGDLARGNKLVRLLGAVMTGAGATVGSIPGALAAYAGTEAVSHPKTVGLGARALKKTGGAIEKAGQLKLNSYLDDLLKLLVRSGAERAVNQ